MNNNKMKRLNGEIRDTEKVFRDLKKMPTLVLDGMKVCYNFTKKYRIFERKDTSRPSLIELDGKNKKIIIINASLSKDTV